MRFLGLIANVRARRDDELGLVFGACDQTEDADGRMTRYLHTLM